MTYNAGDTKCTQKAKNGECTTSLRCSPQNKRLGEGCRRVGDYDVTANHRWQKKICTCHDLDEERPRRSHSGGPGGQRQDSGGQGGGGRVEHPLQHVGPLAPDLDQLPDSGLQGQVGGSVRLSQHRMVGGYLISRPTLWSCLKIHFNWQSVDRHLHQVAQHWE